MNHLNLNLNLSLSPLSPLYSSVRVHAQLKLTGSPPLQRGTARTQEPLNQANAYNSRANQRTNNKPNKPNPLEPPYLCRPSPVAPAPLFRPPPPPPPLSTSSSSSTLAWARRGPRAFSRVTSQSTNASCAMSSNPNYNLYTCETYRRPLSPCRLIQLQRVHLHGTYRRPRSAQYNAQSLVVWAERLELVSAEWALVAHACVLFGAPKTHLVVASERHHVVHWRHAYCAVH